MLTLLVLWHRRRPVGLAAALDAILECHRAELFEDGHRWLVTARHLDLFALRGSAL